jgi:hypothetical protein
MALLNFQSILISFFDKRGTWKLGESDVAAFCNLTFANKELVNQVNAGMETIYITDPSSKNGSKRVPLLYFGRQK